MTSDEAREPMMTLEEVAAFLRTTPAALYSLRHAGRGPRGYRVGKQLRFRAAEVEQWLESRRDQPPSDQPPEPEG